MDDVSEASKREKRAILPVAKPSARLDSLVFEPLCWLGRLGTERCDQVTTRRHAEGAGPRS